MDESLRAQTAAYLAHIDRLIRRGRELRDRLAGDPSDGIGRELMRAWQQDCAVLVNELSGGSKAHWLSRAYSEAFLVRSTGGGVIHEVTPGKIVDRIVDVLARADASLSQFVEREGLHSHESGLPTTDTRLPTTDYRLPTTDVPLPRRFDFVHNEELRPVLEQAFRESQNALENGQYADAFMTSCGILEAVITDALEQAGPNTTIAEWSFETRIAAAERSGLIRGGCARLPNSARTYRELADPDGSLHAQVSISERDARVTRQVLNTVMRDLNPGR